MLSHVPFESAMSFAEREGEEGREHNKIWLRLDRAILCGFGMRTVTQPRVFGI